jgi:hypothetical protein
MNPAIRQSMLHQAANDWGFESVDKMLEAATFDSVVPGVCQCGYVTDTEPDGRSWCENCNKPSCISVLLLAGII